MKRPRDRVTLHCEPKRIHKAARLLNAVHGEKIEVNNWHVQESEFKCK
uniref:Uncharacterized protein n=1 Tax=Arundo donax TaxID=35708 RepID=A0A0A8XWC9_ARUDO